MPQVRARHLKSKLATAERLLGSEAVQRVLAPEMLRAVAMAHGTDWLPVEWEVLTTRAFYEVLGPDVNGAIANGVILDALEGPLLGPIMRKTTGMMKMDASKWARWIPRAWSIVFKDVGEWVVKGQMGTEVQVELRHLPEICVEDVVWPRSVGNSLSALQAQAGVPGRTELVCIDTEQCIATYAVR